MRALDLLMVMFLFAVATCSSANQAKTEAGIPSDSGSAAGSDAAAPTTCAQIRACVHRCGDSACAQRCVSSAPANARSAYEAARTCTATNCPQQDVSCRCTAECLMPGPCTDLVDRCLEGQPDPFCDELCH